jgi:hypothetical protein
VHEALGGAFPKRHHVDCGLIAIICKVPVLGRYNMPPDIQKTLEEELMAVGCIGNSTTL